MFALCAKPEPNISDLFPRQYCTEPIAFVGITIASPWQNKQTRQARQDRQGKTRQDKTKTKTNMLASISCIWPEYGNCEKEITLMQIKQVKQSNFPSHCFTAEVGFSGIASGWSVLRIHPGVVQG
ncbi:hypothetical protein EAE99_011382 [Botrytis elliptica]|nr:hypothetical protein EAE99_011382 [Botrytis elliptica]